MGYHLGGLAEHFVSSKRSDFLEMALHHFLTLYLYGGCYMCNCWECGGVIAFMHDIADVTANLVKGLSETKYKRLAAGLFIGHILNWAYTRMYVLPFLIYGIHIYGPDMGSAYLKPIFCYLLSGLCALHFYWFYIKL